MIVLWFLSVKLHYLADSLLPLCMDYKSGHISYLQGWTGDSGSYSCSDGSVPAVMFQGNSILSSDPCWLLSYRPPPSDAGTELYTQKLSSLEKHSIQVACCTLWNLRSRECSDIMATVLCRCCLYLECTKYYQDNNTYSVSINNLICIAFVWSHSCVLYLEPSSTLILLLSLTVL